MKPWREKQYELAYIKNGSLVRGGIKAPILTVAGWLEAMPLKEDLEYVIVPANEDAITEEEFVSRNYEVRED